jgi:hypothetical protein
MSNADVSTIERNVRRKEAGKFKGKTISHSDIMRRRGGDSNVVNFRNLGAGAGELVDGGKAVSISSNSTYNMYLFYMAPQSSTGRKKITAGFKTIIINSGTAFVTVEDKDASKHNKFSAGSVINVKRGNTYELSSGTHEVEFMVVHGMDIKEKTVTGPIANTTGLQQRVAAKSPEVDIRSIKPRKRKSKEERAEMGRQYEAAKGISTSQEKNQIARDIARGVTHDAPQTVVGANPTPMGDIGDDYLPEAS